MKLSSILLNLANFANRIRQLEYRLGLIADYVVEKGTSGIWTYRKWESGVIECWGEHTYTNLPMTRQFGSGYITTGTYGAQGNFAFPFTFTKVDFVHYSATGSNVWVMYDNSPTTTNSGYCWIYKADAAGTKTVTLHVNAKGLWKNMGGVIKTLFYKLFPVRGCLA